MHGEPVLMHHFLVQFIARRIPISSYTKRAAMELKFSFVRTFIKR